MNSSRLRRFPPIDVVESLGSVVNLESPYVKTIMDRRQRMTHEFVELVVKQALFGWQGTTPVPALDSRGVLQTAEIDLLTFLVTLALRGAVIELPEYRARRQVRVMPHERRIGVSRFGKIVGLVSDYNSFSFSVLVVDHSVVKADPTTEKETIGAPRAFMVIDADRYRFQGWESIVWHPTAAENELLTKAGLWRDNRAHFEYWIHPESWRLVFGAPYLILKLLLMRLHEEAKFLNREARRLAKSVARLSMLELDRRLTASAPPRPELGPVRKVSVESLECELEVPDFLGEYPRFPDSREGRDNALERHDFLVWKLRPLAQFPVRAAEAAWYTYGANRVAPWLSRKRWYTPRRPPRSRMNWQRIVLSQKMALTVRRKKTTLRVSA